MAHLKFGTACATRYLVPLEETLKEVQLVERLGYDLFTVGDTLFYKEKGIDAVNAWLVLSQICANTTTLKFGPSVTDPHRIHPCVTAQMAATLDVFSNGRFVLGVGPGLPMILEPTGIPWKKPVSKMMEAIQLIKRLWTEDDVRFQGEFFHTTNASLYPKPIQTPHPPILVAGDSPRAVRVAGEVGTAWIPEMITPNAFQDDVERIHRAAKKAGRPREEIDNFEPTLLAQTYVSTDYEEALNHVKPFAELLIWQLPPKRAKRLGMKLPLTEEALKDNFVFGTPDDCIATLERYVKAGMRRCMVRPLGEKGQRRPCLELYAHKIMPYFQGR